MHLPNKFGLLTMFALRIVGVVLGVVCITYTSCSITRDDTTASTRYLVSRYLNISYSECRPESTLASLGIGPEEIDRFQSFVNLETNMEVNLVEMAVSSGKAGAADLRILDLANHLRNQRIPESM